MSEEPILKANRTSVPSIQMRVEKLRKEFPELFVDGELNLEKVKNIFSLEEITDPDRFRFEWAGKKSALQLLQLPTRATLKPDRSTSINWETTKHTFIRGENLEVLKLLLRPYYGRVKAIYIDPPYNTGNDLVYEDDYSDPLGSYLRASGQKDEEGDLLTSNPETAGRYHSSWLSMMYPRVFLARQLMRNDGIIVISIDDHEFSNLRLILNEIFGEENFIGAVIWNSTKTVTNTALISVSHTYNVIYAKSKDYFVENRHHFRLPEPGEGFENPNDDPRGPWKADPFQVGGVRPNQLYEITNPNTGEVYTPNPGNSWKNELKVFKQLITDDRIVFGKTGEAGPQRKRFLFEAEERGRVAKTLWDDLDTTANATRYQMDLFGLKVFSNPKPVDLIERFLELSIHDPRDTIVIDFFAGSCTTAEAVLRMNASDGADRKYIMIQIPETLDEQIELDDGTVLQTIDEIGRERIKRAIARIKEEYQDDQHTDDKLKTSKFEPNEMGFRFFKLEASNIKPWEGVESADAESYVSTIEDYLDPLVEGWKVDDLIFEMAIKEAGYGLNCFWELSEGIKDQEIYKVIRGEESEEHFFICLDDSIDLQVLEPLELSKTDLFICRAVALDDRAAANLALQCRLRVI